MAGHGGDCAGCTTNRGVEAKLVHHAITCLDQSTSASGVSAPAEDSAPTDSSSQNAHRALDHTGSYVQVVLQKPRRAHAAAQTSPRLPSASSPIGQIPAAAVVASAAERAGGGCAARRSLYTPYPDGERGASARAAPRQHQYDSDPDDISAVYSNPDEIYDIPTWKILTRNATEKLILNENVCAPERVEVYYFERGGGAFLATAGGGGGGGVPRVEQLARRAAAPAAAALRELCAAAQLLLALPVALLVHTERCVAVFLRDLVTGVVQTAADYVYKPALALAFNALAAPALTCAGQAARALRQALRPLWRAAADALRPLAALLARARLVQLHVAPRCACRPALPPGPTHQV